MKGGSEEALPYSDYSFSLRALGHKKTALTVFHDFSPVICQQEQMQNRKTFKPISLIPLYRSQCGLPFQTELDLPTSFLKIEPQQPYRSPHINIPKPLAQFCQVCKEKFEDYMKHTSHPFHTEKVKELHSSLNFDSLKEILKRSNNKEKKVTVRETKVEEIFYSPAKYSQKDENEDQLEQKFSFGSKKRIVVNTEGDLEVLSLIGSTKVIQSEGEISSQKSIRRYPCASRLSKV